MSEFAQVYLINYLGTWKFELNGVKKYYSVTPTGNTFIIRWSNTLGGLVGNQYISVEDSTEVYQRILSKARGGFQLISRASVSDNSPKCFDTYDNIEEVLESERTESRKRKPRKRKLSLLDWVGGLEEYRENDSL